MRGMVRYGAMLFAGSCDKAKRPPTTSRGPFPELGGAVQQILRGLQGRTNPLRTLLREGGRARGCSRVFYFGTFFSATRGYGSVSLARVFATARLPCLVREEGDYVRRLAYRFQQTPRLLATYSF